MMCQPAKEKRYLGVRGGIPCECGCIPPFRRHYSSEEERQHLETYRDQLKKELAGVEERISEITGKNP